MHAPHFEAVPNFSEGRDHAKITRIKESVRAVPGVRILGLHSDPDHNRSVLTFVGEEDAVLSGAIALARCAQPSWISLLRQASIPGWVCWTYSPSSLSKAPR
jgi:glutamate formiminotransferase